MHTFCYFRVRRQRARIRRHKATANDHSILLLASEQRTNSYAGSCQIVDYEQTISVEANQNIKQKAAMSTSALPLSSLPHQSPLPAAGIVLEGRATGLSPDANIGDMHV